MRESRDDVAPDEHAIVDGDAGTELDGERLFRFASFDATLRHDCA